MLTAALIAVAVVGFVAWALCRAAARNDAFDEHAATALALLQPDNPALPADTPFADEVETWLATEHTQEKP